jgi:8-oxoguanine deaminase
MHDVLDYAYVFKTPAGSTIKLPPPRRSACASTPVAAPCPSANPKGGLPPDDCVEDEKAILTDCVRAIETYHDVSAPP